MSRSVTGSVRGRTGLPHQTAEPSASSIFETKTLPRVINRRRVAEMEIEAPVLKGERRLLPGRDEKEPQTR
jgi:hypothetical protein